MTTYKGTMNFDTLYLRADFSEASCQIEYETDGEWESSPYQVADACHDVETAYRLVIGWLGPDYYGYDYDYDDDDDDDDMPPGLRDCMEQLEIERYGDDEDEDDNDDETPEKMYAFVWFERISLERKLKILDEIVPAWRENRDCSIDGCDVQRLRDIAESDGVELKLANQDDLRDLIERCAEIENEKKNNLIFAVARAVATDHTVGEAQYIRESVESALSENPDVKANEIIEMIEEEEREVLAEIERCAEIKREKGLRAQRTDCLTKDE